MKGVLGSEFGPASPNAAGRTRRLRNVRTAAAAERSERRRGGRRITEDLLGQEPRRRDAVVVANVAVMVVVALPWILSGDEVEAVVVTVEEEK